ncbi:MAG: type II toxin-antitoxin system VapC family toxin [Sulfurovum sp.]|nr:type II toxin-antitoxin system VapC family toxin [Sulfurovum sp.]
MHNSIYVDTNIVIDMCDNTRAMHENSFSRIIEHMEQEACELFINSDTLANVFYILSNRSTLDTSEVLDKMYFISDIFTLVHIESDDVLMALDLCSDSAKPNKDYEDAVQYVCAKKIEADLIVTNDKKFVYLDIEICSTFDKIS